MDNFWPKYWFSILVLVQIFTGIVASVTDIFLFKISVAALGSIALLLVYRGELLKIIDVWIIILAFVCSMIGDYFLSHMQGDTTFFIIGISFYLLAHIGYLIFSLLNGAIYWKGTIGITVIFLIYFYFALYPSIEDKTLALMVLFYLLVSCVSLGASLGLKMEGAVKWPYVFGITLILF